MSECACCNMCFFSLFRRLGYADGNQILDHPLFGGFDVAGVAAGAYVPSYIPAQTFLTGINVEDGQDADPSSFFDSMSAKEEKRFVEIFQEKNISHS